MKRPVAILLAFWVLATLAFGGVADSFDRVYVLLTAILSAAIYLRLPRFSEGAETEVPTPYARLLLFLILIGAIGFLVILQLIPSPRFLMRWLSPLAFDLRWRTLGEIGIHTNTMFPFTLDGASTFVFVSQFLAFLLLLAISIEVLATREARRLSAFVIVAFSAFVAFFGMAHRFSHNPKAYWLVQKTWTVFGPYLNRNHAGGLLAVATAVGIGLLLRPASQNQRMILGCLVSLCALGLFFTGSRAGFLSLVIAMIFVFRAKVSGSSTAKMLLRSALPILAGVLLLAVAWQASLFTRMASTPERLNAGLEFRTQFWGYAIELFTKAPWLGIGMGAFSRISPVMVGDRYFLHPEHVENDLLEVLACGGIFLFLLVCVLLAFLVKRCRHILLSDTSITSKAFFFGTLALGVNSLFVFHAPLPAHQILWALLLGGMIASHRHTLLFDPIVARVFRVCVLAGFFLGVISIFRPGMVSPKDKESLAGAISATDKHAEVLLEQTAAEDALSIDPLDFRALYSLAGTNAKLGDAQRAWPAYFAAVRLWPYALPERAKIVQMLSRGGHCDGGEDHLEELLEGPYPIPAGDRATLLIDAAYCSFRSRQTSKTEDRLTRAEKLGATDWRIPLLRAFYLQPAAGLVETSWKMSQTQKIPPVQWDHAFKALSIAAQKPIDLLDVLPRVALSREDAGPFLLRMSSLFPSDELPVRIPLDLSEHKLVSNTPMTEANTVWETVADTSTSQTFTVRVHQAQPVIDVYSSPLEIRAEPKELSFRMLVASLRPLNQQLVLNVEGRWVVSPDEPVRLPTGQWELTFKNIGTVIQNYNPKTPPKIRAIGFTPLERDGRYTVGPIEIFVDRPVVDSR
jgi:O-antigen ligase